MNDETIRDFINKHNWTFAKTYAGICPHEYIVKDKLDQGDGEVMKGNYASFKC